MQCSEGRPEGSGGLSRGAGALRVQRPWGEGHLVHAQGGCCVLGRKVTEQTGDTGLRPENRVLRPQAEVRGQGTCGGLPVTSRSPSCSPYTREKPTHKFRVLHHNMKAFSGSIFRTHRYYRVLFRPLEALGSLSRKPVKQGPSPHTDRC